MRTATALYEAQIASNKLDSTMKNYFKGEKRGLVFRQGKWVSIEELNAKHPINASPRS